MNYLHRLEIQADSRYPIDRKRIRLLVDAVLVREGVNFPVTVSLAVVGNRKMKLLNRQYHETEGTTDVLSFPYLDPLSNHDLGQFVVPDEAGRVLGDMVISYPEAVRQAREKGVLVDEEIDFLLEHGLKHLLGQHHD